MNSRQILVVDDDHGMVATLRDILELHGWETRAAFDGAEAIALVRDHPIDVVLMDVKMPKIDGVTALLEMRKLRPNLRVILMTAFAAAGLLSQVERAGPVRVFRKPLDIRALLELLAARDGARPVLVVDDDAAFRRTLCDVLEQYDMPTTQASTVAEALVRLERDEPGAVLLDLRLDHTPIGESISAIKELKPDVPLVLYSGHPEALSAATRAAPDGVITATFTKPLPIERLIHVLDAARTA